MMISLVHPIASRRHAYVTPQRALGLSSSAGAELKTTQNHAQRLAALSVATLLQVRSQRSLVHKSAISSKISPNL